MHDSDDAVPVSDARARIAHLVGRAQHAGERTVLTKHGRVVAAIVGPADLDRLTALDAPRDSDHVVRLEVSVQAPPDTVWWALTSPVGRSPWWPGVVLVDHAGGAFGIGEQVTGEVAELLAERRLVLRWEQEGWPTPTWVRVDLLAEGEGTRLGLTHDGFAALPDGAAHAEDLRAEWREWGNRLRAAHAPR